MGAFLEAAFRVLKEAGEPLTARAISALAIEKGFLVTTGKTPWQTMKSKLSTDILSKGESSPFMRTKQGTFGLREWPDRKEFVADRYQKALFDEDILVFSADSLHRYAPRPGLHFVDLAALVAECRNMRRATAEEDLTVVQLVSAFVVRNGDRILTHKRSKRLPESRLHGYYSVNFGGHLNPDDVSPLFSVSAADQWEPWLTRELQEELLIPPRDIKKLKYRGLLYDDAQPVSKQHVAVTYEVVTDRTDFRIGERGFLIDAKFETLDQIRSRLTEFENWSVRLVGEMDQWIRDQR